MAELLMDQVHAVMVSFGIPVDDVREFDAIQADLMAGLVVLRFEDGFSVAHDVVTRSDFDELLQPYNGDLEAFLADSVGEVVAGL
jgi:hypothetical protein